MTPSQVSRWSGSAWLFGRRGGNTQLALGGMLGGSQAGARIAYRLNEDASRPISLSARFYSPLGQVGGSEAALGVEWQPAARLPVRILIERRQAIGSGGRSDFALLAHGGIGEVPLLGGFRLDGYGQAGIVGIEERDLFADSAARVSLQLNDSVSAGAGAWGAAQTGVARLDVGPQIRIRLPVRDRSVTLGIDWRFRVAGDAAEASGPAITLSTGF